MIQKFYNIHLSNIITEGTLYSDFYKFFKKDYDSLLKDNIFLLFDNLIFSEIIFVQKIHDNEFKLVDGFLLFEYLKDKNQQYVPCVVFDKNSANFIFNLLLLKYHNIICSSCAFKIKFLKFIYDAQISEDMIVQIFLPILKFPQNIKVYEQIKSAFILDDDFMRYLHQKDASLSQIYMFCQYDKYLLNKVFSLSKELNLSISLMEEFCENLNDLCIAKNLNIDQLWEELKIQEILNSNLNISTKLFTIRDVILKNKYPTLNEVNNQISGYIKQLNIPKNCEITWDKMLEDSAVKMVCKISNIDDIKNLVHFLNDEQRLSVFKKVLDNL